MLPAQILAQGFLTPYPTESGLSQFFEAQFRTRDELKLKGSGFMCLTGLMKARIGEMNKINLVCYFERCCINTVKDGLSLKMDKRGQKEEKQKCRGRAIGSSLPRLLSDCCDSQHYQSLVLPPEAAVAPIYRCS